MQTKEHSNPHQDESHRKKKKAIELWKQNIHIFDNNHHLMFAYNYNLIINPIL